MAKEKVDDLMIELGQESNDKFIPRHTRGGIQKSDQILVVFINILQLCSLGVCAYYYSAWYKISPVGSSAVVSCMLCGFSQGLLQSIVHKRLQKANLLKYYCWGIVNGIWTVSCFKSLWNLAIPQYYQNY